MQFKAIILALIASAVSADKCPAQNDNCGDVSLPPNAKVQLNATYFSEPNFKGESKTVSIDKLFGCVNDIPEFAIKSLLSTASTQITLHYGKDCAGHVIDQMQGGSFNLDQKKACPGSIFIKAHRFGSC